MRGGERYLSSRKMCFQKCTTVLNGGCRSPWKRLVIKLETVCQKHWGWGRLGIAESQFRLLKRYRSANRHRGGKRAGMRSEATWVKAETRGGVGVRGGGVGLGVGGIGRCNGGGGSEISEEATGLPTFGLLRRPKLTPREA